MTSQLSKGIKHLFLSQIFALFSTGACIAAETLHMQQNGAVLSVPATAAVILCILTGIIASILELTGLFLCGKEDSRFHILLAGSIACTALQIFWDRVIFGVSVGTLLTIMQLFLDICALSLIVDVLRQNGSLLLADQGSRLRKVYCFTSILLLAALNLPLHTSLGISAAILTGGLLILMGAFYIVAYLKFLSASAHALCH